jgi:hypothetical protein
MKTIKTHNTYEASFYMLYGGKFANVRKTVLNKREASKKGFVDMWTITLDNVPEWLIDTWRTGQAYGNITSFVDVRNKLKKVIKRDLNSNINS